MFANDMRAVSQIYISIRKQETCKKKKKNGADIKMSTPEPADTQINV